jgi:hypothetical protein
MRNALLVCSLVAATALAATGCAEPGTSRQSPLAPTGPDGTAAKPSADLSVTTTIENIDANGFQADLTNDDLGSYFNGVDGVRSVLTANVYNGLTHGDWQFNVPATSPRKFGIALDQDDAVQPGEPDYIVPATPPFWGTRRLPGDAKVKCTAIGNSMIAMTAGTTFTCPLLNHFDMPDGGYGRHPEVQVTCNAANAAGCADWFIEPIGQDRAIARLMQRAARPNQPSTHIGTFYVRLRIHVTRP